MPQAIAKLSTEGRNLVETLGQAKGTAHRLLEERIEDIGDQLARHERKLTEVQRTLAALDQTEIETQWVIEKVEVDEPSGQVTAVLVDLELDAGVPPLGQALANDAEKTGGDGMTDGMAQARVHGRQNATQRDEQPQGTHIFTGQLFRVRDGHGCWAFSGDYVDRADVARQLGFTRARVTQLLDLTLLAPNIQERVLDLEAIDGREPLTERGLRAVVTQTSWGKQR